MAMDRVVPMMKCGHAANAKDESGNPTCAICCGISEGWNVVEDKLPDLTNRKARCTYYNSKCGSERSSSVELAFFAHKPNKPYDEYYCGCFGWD